jgi:hypothetical protein
MSSKMKKIVGSLLLGAVLMAVTIPKARAFGETGCIRNPENIVGICGKNTEGIWKCIDGYAYDCTESGD